MSGEEQWSLEKIIACALCYRSVGDVHARTFHGSQRWEWFQDDAKQFIDAYGWYFKERLIAEGLWKFPIE